MKTIKKNQKHLSYLQKKSVHKVFYADKTEVHYDKFGNELFKIYRNGFFKVTEV